MQKISDVSVLFLLNALSSPGDKEILFNKLMVPNTILDHSCSGETTSERSVSVVDNAEADRLIVSWSCGGNEHRLCPSSGEST